MGSRGANEDLEDRACNVYRKGVDLRRHARRLVRNDGAAYRNQAINGLTRAIFCGGAKVISHLAFDDHV